MDGIWSAQVIWFLAGAVFLVAELALPGFVLLFFAVGAFAASLAALSGLGLAGQLSVFIAATLAGVALLRRLFLRVFRGRTHSPGGDDGQDPGLDDMGAGQAAVVTRAMAPDRPGEIKFRGSFWRAESRTPIAEGENVVIVGRAKGDAGAYLVRPAAGGEREGGA